MKLMNNFYENWITSLGTERHEKKHSGMLHLLDLCLRKYFPDNNDAFGKISGKHLVSCFLSDFGETMTKIMRQFLTDFKFHMNYE